MELRAPNYRQQKKAKEEARKVRQNKKLERRQVSAPESVEPEGAQDADGKDLNAK